MRTLEHLAAGVRLILLVCAIVFAWGDPLLLGTLMGYLLLDVWLAYREHSYD